MKIRKNLIHWIVTLTISTAMVQLIGVEEELQGITALGYPSCFLSILALWKLPGMVAILVPGFLLVKEWAYARFFFVMSGASISHIISGNSMTEIFPSLLLLILTVVFWYLRLSNRTLVLQVKT